MAKLWSSFTQPSVLMLLVAAMARHTAGYTWAYNTRLYFQSYHPHFSLGYWILTASCVGGSFGRAQYFECRNCKNENLVKI